MKTDCVFLEAEHLGFSSASIAGGGSALVRKCNYYTGGWVCAQNSSQNPNRREETEHVQNFGNDSGETLLFYANALQTCGATLGFGENVSSLFAPQSWTKLLTVGFAL